MRSWGEGAFWIWGTSSLRCCGRRPVWLAMESRKSRKSGPHSCSQQMEASSQGPPAGPTLHTAVPSPQPQPTLAPLRARISGFYHQGSKRKEHHGPVSLPPAFKGGIQQCVLSRDPVDVGNGCGAVTANWASTQKSCPREIVQEQAQSQRHKAAEPSSASARSSALSICRQWFIIGLSVTAAIRSSLHCQQKANSAGRFAAPRACLMQPVKAMIMKTVSQKRKDACGRIEGKKAECQVPSALWSQLDSNSLCIGI